MFEDLEARETEAKKLAVEKLTNTIAKGADEQTAIIKHVMARTIVDRLVDPRLGIVEEHDSGGFSFRYDEERQATISSHALGQMCAIARIPKTYINALTNEEAPCVGMSRELRRHLVCYLFNQHFQFGIYLDRKGNRTKFLHRILPHESGPELCGFLSRNYNRKLGTKNMMRPFIEECTILGAKPCEAFASNLRTVLKCILPVVFEPVDGEFVAIGATYANSDFGSGSLEVTGVILRIKTGTSSVLENKLRKIHLGAIISDEEIELSEETLEKEAAAHISAVRDMTRNIFSKENIERSLKMVKYSIENKIAWNKLKDKLSDVLKQDELTSVEEMLKATKSGIIDLPPVTSNDAGDPEANAWWAAAALGVIAARTNDTDRKADMQGLAGKLISKGDKS